ncbi:hypothetical protein AAVH_30806 [Aphelenchoides avenae]|nr:hypothetical protein AAVH_30806 [Aphelenchus avenae]
MYVSLIEALCEEFKCTPNRLRLLINHPYYLHRTREFLEKRMLRTNYVKRTPRCFRMAKLTAGDALTTDAYEGWKKINVDTHYTCKYQIDLRFPKMPLVAMEMGKESGHFRFYPLEMLTVAFTTDS